MLLKAHVISEPCREEKSGKHSSTLAILNWYKSTTQLSEVCVCVKRHTKIYKEETISNSQILKANKQCQGKESVLFIDY